MRDYVATFHTHLSALMTDRNLKGAGVQARMMPVFRKLSSSCGTCVVYAAPGPCLERMDEDVDGAEDAPSFLSQKDYSSCSSMMAAISRAVALSSWLLRPPMLSISSMSFFATAFRDS